ncbi:ABC transporter ATP-binding protein [Bradyrhizobium sp. JYMT SZCCT0428]|uniref:ABC transporter ATP-binding protein n=1 Tax=Bradyrhizobium sp. JYMT SZCCT0428 TaxID=2807673 RepID=UPI001BAC2A41|nr:ABC transporter ATP-binding protein [Bradyrhizobium sp. JYMT SZCCT0428]MBR1149445.1 ABC transporter ATP-binding protein [Bradyrhizobium sp. JYMT SZCCT0428]
MAAVVLNNVTKLFGETAVIKGISMSIAKGEFVSLLGPSGCGKTTLLRMIAGLEQTTSGSIIIGEKDSTALPPEKRDIAMVFQSYALLPHLNVFDNVMFPLRMRNLGTRQEQARRVKDVLEMVQLSHLATRRPRELSGGQQQRVAVARAVVSSPQVLLLDEPLSNLDARLRESMQEELIQLHRQTGLTTIFVTHDQEEALSLSDRIILLNEGTIEQEGTPAELYGAPTTRFSAGFMGSSNILDVELVMDGDACRAMLSAEDVLTLAKGYVRGGASTITFRQEDVQLAPAGDSTCTARVETAIFLGSRVRYVVRAGLHCIRCLATDGQIFKVGETVALQVAPNRIRVLD